MPKTRHFLGISRVFLYDFLSDISFNYFVSLVKENSKHLQISRSLINFKGNSHFQGVSSALEIAFQIQALFKGFKDLREG